MMAQGSWVLKVVVGSESTWLLSAECTNCEACRAPEKMCSRQAVSAQEMQLVFKRENPTMMMVTMYHDFLRKSAS